MTHSWFIYSNEIVTGPFDTETVRAKLTAGLVPANSFIWWKGQREWIPVATWESQLEHLLKGATERSQKPVWYFELSGKSIGPLTEDELIKHLQGIEQLSRVRLWAVGMAKWTSLYEVHDIMEKLGISRRENDRAPLMGSVAVTRSNEDPKGFMLRAASISVAGMGVTGSHDLRVGDSLSLLIKSSELPGNIHLRGEVAYVTANNYVGIRFHKVHPETQSLIFDYVKRFNTNSNQSDRAA